VAKGKGGEGKWGAKWGQFVGCSFSPLFGSRDFPLLQNTINEVKNGQRKNIWKQDIIIRRNRIACRKLE